MDKEQEERILELEELKSSQKFVSMQTVLLSLGLAIFLKTLNNLNYYKSGMLGVF